MFQESEVLVTVRAWSPMSVQGVNRQLSMVSWLSG
jgi:hypothetical protein